MILVTGSSGLVGRALVAALRAQDRPVRGMDRLVSPRARTTDFQGDLCDDDACRLAVRGVRTIIHTAARQYHDGPPRWARRRFFQANVNMTGTLVAAAVRAGVRHVVYLSSDMVYGLPPGRALREGDSPRPIGPYGESKRAGEMLCEQARSAGLAATILRPRLIVGPGRLGVLRRLFDRIRRGLPVPVIGDGLNRYQMVAVDDVVSACLLAVERQIEGTFNIGSENPPRVRDLLDGVCRRVGSASRLLHLPRAAARAALEALNLLRLAPLAPEQYRIADVDYVLDTSAARRILGWRPRLADLDMLVAAYETYVASAAAPAAPTVASRPHPSPTPASEVFAA